MVRLTADMLVRSASSYVKRQRDETRKHYLKRLTHLHLENRHIDDAGDALQTCRSLVVLYLYDNLLTCIPTLDRNVSLAHLYLQNNNISRLEGLSTLTNLTKLYLGGNSIAVLEGLEGLSQLQELHIENQQLSDGDKLIFDTRSVSAIAGSLMVLNVSGNGVTSLCDLDCLYQLRQLLATHNRLTNVGELTLLLSMSWRQLERLDVADNPLCRRGKYRDLIIVAAPSLEILDGAEVSETTKQFLRSWQANKEAIRQRIESGVSANGHSSLQSTATDSGVSLQKSFSGDYFTQSTPYMMPALQASRFKKLLSRSRSQQSHHDQRAAMQEYFGYSDGAYGQQRSRSDVLGSQIQHLSLHNISLDAINGGHVPL